MKFEYLKNLRGPNGERFADDPVDYRAPKFGEWYIASDHSAIEALCDHLTSERPRLILRRLKTAREWLLELPDGWREEALANCLDSPMDSWRGDKNSCPDLQVAICFYLPDWETLPSGEDGWRDVLYAIKKGTPIPPHPSTIPKPPAKKTVRLDVVKRDKWLYAGDIRLDGWLGRDDFRGFVYNVFGSFQVRGFAIGWLDADGVLHDQPVGSHCHPLRPSFVEVEQ